MRFRRPRTFITCMLCVYVPPHAYAANFDSAMEMVKRDSDTACEIYTMETKARRAPAGSQERENFERLARERKLEAERTGPSQQQIIAAMQSLSTADQNRIRAYMRDQSDLCYLIQGPEPAIIQSDKVRPLSTRPRRIEAAPASGSTQSAPIPGK
jgi:hypothetical protein